MSILLRALPYWVRYERQQRRIEGRELPMAPDPAEALLRLDQRRSRPAQRHRPSAPALHALGHSLERAVQILDRVRRAERAIQRALRPERQEGKRLVEAL